MCGPTKTMFGSILKKMFGSILKNCLLYSKNVWVYTKKCFDPYLTVDFGKVLDLRGFLHFPEMQKVVF